MKHHVLHLVLHLLEHGFWGFCALGIFIGLALQDFPWDGPWSTLHDLGIHGGLITYTLTTATARKINLPGGNFNGIILGPTSISLPTPINYELHLWPLLFWLAVGAIIGKVVKSMSGHR